jgi:ribosomal protein L4
MAKGFSLADKKVLLVVKESEENNILSVRNVPNALMMRAIDLNAYSVLNNDAIIMTEDSVNLINEF